VLFRRGFTKNLLLPGTEIVVDGYQAKDAAPRERPEPPLPNGKMLFLIIRHRRADELTPENQKK
jgi:hypothetical protein